MKILFLCTGNSCRSQMAEAIFNRLANGRHVGVSAGSHPKDAVNPHAIRVLERHGYDISKLYPKHLDQFIDSDVDVVITLCDKMHEICPVFPDKPALAHFGSPDPVAVEGSELEVNMAFNKVFAEISNRLELIVTVMDRESTRVKVQEGLDVHAKAAVEGRI